MKFGTKLGWILVAFSIVLSIWVISGIGNEASTTDENGFVIEDDGVTLSGYTGPGGAISIPSGITTIASGVFADNGSVTSVTVPDTVTSMGTGVFSGCTNMSSVTLSGNLSSIPDSTFYNCSSLSGVSLPGVSSIGSNAFYGCSSLPSITIPSGVSSIGSGAFDECPGMSSITVSGGNSSYTSYDGCLYNISGSNLIRCPEGKSSLNLSSSCTTISADALKNCNYVSTLTIPATVTSIGSQSNWNPSVIYGYSDSAAETYAAQNGITFEVIGTDDPGNDDPDDNGGGENGDNGNTDNGNTDNGNTDNGNTDNGNTDNGNTDNGNTDNGNTDNGNTDNGNTDNGNTEGNNGTTGTGTTTGTGGSTSGGASGNGGHVKDATPKTADGDIDPRYFLSLGFLLAGVAAILYSNKKKINYLKEHRNK